MKAGIKQSLKSDGSIIKPNTGGRPGYIFEKDFGKVIGNSKKGDPLTIMKVVIDEAGNVITAYPYK
ncbi:hypothetical protein BH11BAC7_BH11BAC7_35050 [soil metagenome]